MITRRVPETVCLSAAKVRQPCISIGSLILRQGKGTNQFRRHPRHLRTNSWKDGQIYGNNRRWLRSQTRRLGRFASRWRGVEAPRIEARGRELASGSCSRFGRPARPGAGRIARRRCAVRGSPGRRNGRWRGPARGRSSGGGCRDAATIDQHAAGNLDKTGLISSVGQSRSLWKGSRSRDWLDAADIGLIGILDVGRQTDGQQPRSSLSVGAIVIGAAVPGHE